VDIREYFPGELEAMATLESDGLVELPGDGIEVTPRGRLLLRNIAMTFDRYVGGTQDRYSRAI
jgi:oxygen-independent coproporphyrinogen-3 oxidase